MAHQVIDIGCESKKTVELYLQAYFPTWKDYKLTRVDIDPATQPDVLHDIREPFPESMWHKYDYVHLTHVLEHISWRRAMAAFRNVAALTAPQGFFMLAVPSLEFACQEILRGNFDLGVMGMLYGPQDDEWATHRCGFTRGALQEMIASIQFEVHFAKEPKIGVVINGKTYHGRQHELMLRNPATT